MPSKPTSGCHKFVITDKGIYYSPLATLEVSHKDLVPSGEIPLSAGAISIREGYFKVVDTYSWSLHIRMRVGDNVLIANDLGLQYIGDIA